MQQLFSDVLYLLACAVNEKKADKNRIDAMDLNALFELCKAHNITALVASVLTEQIKESADQYALWSQEQMKALYRDMNFAAERTKVLAFLEENGIWYMPLKGIVLKECYPKPELREFADNDILFDAAFEQQVEAYMLSHGYRRKQTDSGHVMEYEKEPCFNFEMHRSLYYKNNTELYEYYKNVKDHLIKDSDNAFGYHFSDEDFYVFMVSHMYRHYKSSGIGIRALADIYVFIASKKDSLNDAYMQAQFDQMHMDAFEKQMRALALKAFGESNPAFSAEEEQILMFYFRCGTYGTKEVSEENKMRALTGKTDFSSGARRTYWFRRLFDLQKYKEDYPRAYKTKVLIPFLILYRALRGLTKTKALKAENEQLKALEEKQHNATLK